MGSATARSRYARRLAIRIVQQLGAEDRARWIRHALRSRIEIRNHQDEAALRVLMSAVLDSDSNCIDVGAYRGKVLKEIARLAPHGKHIAYEPLPEHHAQLTRQFPQVDVRAKALSNRRGVSEFGVVADDPAYSALPQLSTVEMEHVYPSDDPLRRRPIQIEIERLDDALPDGFRLDFMKIDVEGAEYRVLEGAVETLRRNRPVIAFEHGIGCRRFGTEPGAVYDLLTEEAGLKIFDIDGGGPHDRASLADETCRRWFFFARPPAQEWRSPGSATHP